MRIRSVTRMLLLFVQFLHVASWCSNTDEFLNNGWKKYNGALYKLFDDAPRNYTSWETYCQSYGGSLTTAKTAEENAFVLSINNKFLMFIGLTHDGVNWKWNDGTLASYSNWRTDSRFDKERTCVYVVDNWTPISCSTALHWCVCKCAIVVDAPESHGIPIAAIAGGISAGLVVILLVGIGIFIWRRSQHVEHEERSFADIASNTNLHSDSDTNSQHENHPQPYWAVVTNARGEVFTAPEMDISMELDENISRSPHNRTELEAYSYPLEPEEHEGYIDPIHSDPVEHDGYIDPTHSEPAEHHVYIDPIP